MQRTTTITGPESGVYKFENKSDNMKKTTFTIDGDMITFAVGDINIDDRYSIIEQIQSAFDGRIMQITKARGARLEIQFLDDVTVDDAERIVKLISALGIEAEYTK